MSTKDITEALPTMDTHWEPEAPPQCGKRVDYENRFSTACLLPADHDGPCKDAAVA